MEWVETTGKSVAEALDAALDQLGVDEQEAEYEVLEEAQKGLFGRLRSEARIRARVRPVRPRPKVERRDRRRRGGERSQGRGSGGRRNEAPKAAGRGQTSNGARQAGASGGSGSGASRGGSSAAEATTTTAEVERSGAGGGTSRSAARRRRRRRGRGGGEGGADEAKRTGAEVSTDNGDAGEAEGGVALDVEAQRLAVEEFLGGLVTAFGRPEATVSTVVDEEGAIEADVSGEELGLLVGPKGQTLQAVQELIRSMVQRQFVGEAHARVRVDIAGYRLRRREALERFTRNIAEQVLSSGRPMALDPMLAGDRKVVHDVANEIDGIVTRSEGEDPTRRVIIQPA